MKIRNILHKGLERLFLEDDTKGLPRDAVENPRTRMAFLQDMEDPETLRVFPLWKAHQLSGDRKGVWSLHVTRNWRLTMKTISETKGLRMLNPVHPGRFLKLEIIEAHDLSVTDAAKILRVCRPTLSSLLNGKASLSGEMALRFEKAFDVDMETLMRMQNSFDLAQTRSRYKAVLVYRYRPKPAAQTDSKGAVGAQRAERVFLRPQR